MCISPVRCLWSPPNAPHSFSRYPCASLLHTALGFPFSIQQLLSVRFFVFAALVLEFDLFFFFRSHHSPQVCSRLQIVLDFSPAFNHAGPLTPFMASLFEFPRPMSATRQSPLLFPFGEGLRFYLKLFQSFCPPLFPLAGAMLSLFLLPRSCSFSFFLKAPFFYKRRLRRCFGRIQT